MILASLLQRSYAAYLLAAREQQQPPKPFVPYSNITICLLVWYSSDGSAPCCPWCCCPADGIVDGVVSGAVLGLIWRGAVVLADKTGAKEHIEKARDKLRNKD
jgi:hypothetical protein